MNERDRAYAYVTSGMRLLILEHPEHPDAGLQVPGGTIERGEDPASAVLRELGEETNLFQLEVAQLLGRETFDMRPHGHDEIQHAWFFHVVCLENTPNQWHHYEDHHPELGRIPFRLYWSALPYEGEPLVALHGRMIHELEQIIALN